VSAEPAAKSTLREYYETIVHLVSSSCFTKTFVFQHSRSHRLDDSDAAHRRPTSWSNRYIYARSMGALDKLCGRVRTPRDVVVFSFPMTPTKTSSNASSDPGDTIELRRDGIYVNGERRPEPYKWLDPKLAYRIRFASRAWPAPAVCGPAGRYFLMGE